MRPLRILYVAYPLLPVSEASAGGAEQMLWTLEREVAARGHRTTVAACEGSSVAGELAASGPPPDAPDRYEQRRDEHISFVLGIVARREAEGRPFDLVHDKSGSLWAHAARVAAPLLATLHLPRSFYPAAWFEHLPPNLVFNCVSRSQHATFRDLAAVRGVVPNGIALDRFAPAADRPREYLLWLGRICEEKGAHVALDVAHALGRRIVVAGAVYPFLYHQKYFAREIIPRLKRAGRAAHFISAPAFGEKVSLLQGAQALLIPSGVDETSSLVAMEAAACGTPVVAFRRGALPEVVEEERTGFVVDDAQAMAAALARAGSIHPERCRAVAEERFSAARMADRYVELYGRVLDAVADATEPSGVSAGGF